MSGLKAMFLDEGPNKNIRCRFICDWCKIESYVYSNARLFSEIEKTHPDVVVMDLGLYEKIDGIKTSRMIRSKFNLTLKSMPSGHGQSSKALPFERLIATPIH